jgi:colicin import membrane protein
MKEPKRSQREFWFVAAAGSGLMLLAGTGAYWIKTNADRPQLRLETSIAENSVLLPASHGLAGDKAVAELLESLPSDLALEVCAGLAGAPARTAKRPCDELREIAAIAPAAPPAPPVRSMVAVEAWEIPTPPIGPQFRVETAPTQSAAVAPQPSPAETPVSPAEPAADAPAIQRDAAPKPRAADLANTLATVGMQIVSAQTTEPRFPVADDGELEVTLLPDPTELVVPAISEDIVAYWLVMSDVPSPGSPETGDVVDGAATDDEATTSTDAATAAAQAQAKAKAQAQAKAKAQAQAKAKAQAQAKARSQARAKVGTQAIAAALNGDKDVDAGNGPNVGSGKDRDQGSGSGGGNLGGGGGGKN